MLRYFVAEDEETKDLGDRGRLLEGMEEAKLEVNSKNIGE